jgi:hypothetical protein
LRGGQEVMNIQQVQRQPQDWLTRMFRLWVELLATLKPLFLVCLTLSVLRSEWGWQNGDTGIFTCTHHGPQLHSVTLCVVHFTSRYILVMVHGWLNKSVFFFNHKYGKQVKSF